MAGYTNQVIPNSRWPGANLFRNPFGELTRAERAEVAVVDLNRILQAIAEPGAGETRRFRRFTAYQLIGECGRGKTTRMLALADRFPESSYVYLPEDLPCPAVAYGEPLLIDEAQRLPKDALRSVLQSGATLVLATHRDLTGALHRFGYEVTTESIGQSLSPRLLAEMLNRRIQASRRDRRHPVPQLTTHDAETLIRRFGTNVRAVEEYLYDVVQTQVNHHGEMRFID